MKNRSMQRRIILMKQWYIAAAAAFLYLAVSLVFKAWTWSWIIWFIYAGYRFWDSRDRSDQKTGIER